MDFKFPVGNKWTNVPVARGIRQQIAKEVDDRRLDFISKDKKIIIVCVFFLPKPIFLTFYEFQHFHIPVKNKPTARSQR